MKVRVWKYCCQSTPDEGLTGLRTQNVMLDAYIAEHGYLLAGKTEAVESGLDPKRESIHEILRLAREGAYDMLLVTCPDRLLNNPFDSLSLFQELKKEGVRIFAVKTEEELPDSRQDFLQSIAAAMATVQNEAKPQTGHPCDVCGRDPLKADGCRVGVVYINGEKFPRIPFFGDLGERCHDCNTLSGHYHHWGCDDERCPACGGQLISCDCLDIECPVIINKKHLGREVTVPSQLDKR